MQAHGLGRSEILRMTKDRHARRLAVYLSTDVTPPPARLVTVLTRVAFGSQKEAVGLAIPLPIAPNTQAPIVILRKNQRTVTGTFLRQIQIKEKIRSLHRTHAVNIDAPYFNERHLRVWPGREINKSMTRAEPAADCPAPRLHEL